MFERLTTSERIDLARTKMKRVVDHFLYVIELHANNAFVVYSPTLVSQIPSSFAANAFNVFQRSMHQIEIVRLCAIWDSADPDKENIPTVIELIDDQSIIDCLAAETRGHWTGANSHLLNPSDDPELAALELHAVQRANKQFADEQAERATTELMKAITDARAILKRTMRKLDVNHPDPGLDAAYRQILMWRRDLEPLNPEPEMPANVRNRLADNWRPLIAIADSLGWGEEGRDAMEKFAAEYQDTDARIALLTAIRTIFDVSGLDRITSHALLDALLVLSDHEWKEFLGVRSEQQPHRIKDGEVASMLRDFKIRPATIWPLRRTADTKSAKGYKRAQFETVWRRYCDDAGTPAQASKVKELG